VFLLKESIDDGLDVFAGLVGENFFELLLFEDKGIFQA